MGRGESKLRRRERYVRQKKATPKTIREMQTQSGKHIEFDQDLIYGNPVSTFSGNDRKIIEAWEARNANKSVEHAALLDANGNLIGEFKGGYGSVKVPGAVVKNATVLTHTHPRTAKSNDEYAVGGTFSDADLNNFAKRKNLTTYRAVAAEGTYCIAKTKNFNAEGFLNYANSCIAKRTGQLKVDAARICKEKAILEFKDYDAYKKAHTNAFNNMLINLHNDYIAGQKTYGYEYSLEERK